MVSLAYLWHQPQAQLLDCMISSNIEAILVKVAAMGLDPARHLGHSLSHMRPHLHRLRGWVAPIFPGPVEHISTPGEPTLPGAFWVTHVLVVCF